MHNVSRHVYKAAVARSAGELSEDRIRAMLHKVL